MLWFLTASLVLEREKIIVIQTYTRDFLESKIAYFQIFKLQFTVSINFQ